MSQRPLQCSNCGHIYWEAAPELKTTYDMLPSGSFTVNDVKILIGATVQMTNNRLRKLESYGLVKQTRVKGRTNIWRKI